MSLQDCQLAYEYRSDSTNIVDNFYIPCLSQSIEYWRAVGYFTSQGLMLAAKGLAAFVAGGGRMRLVASPLLEAEDIEAFKRGYEARDDILERAVLRQLGWRLLAEPPDFMRNRLACLAWLIAEERLDIKLAVPSQRLLTGDLGIYHEKVGIFADSEGNIVAFTGSPNETVGGLASNFESIDVFVSWDDRHQRTRRKRDNFERLWNNATSGLTIADFPTAARERIVRFRTPTKPTRDPESGIKPSISTTWDVLLEGKMETISISQTASMFKVFLQKHFEEIRAQEYPKGCILVYKGFPVDFVTSVGEKFAFLNDPSKVFVGNKIDLQRVLDCCKETIVKMLSIDSGIYVATYEELLAIEDRVDLSLFTSEIMVYDNNFFEWYPNQTTSHFPNIDETVEKGDPSYPEDPLLNQFYVYSDEKFGLTLLQYRDMKVAHENIIKKNFFDTGLVDSQDYVTIETDQIADDSILVSEEEENYFYLKYSVFGNRAPSRKRIVVITDSVTLKTNAKVRTELEILKLVYVSNGYEFSIRVKSAKPIAQCRSEFKDILLKHWGSNSFRELIFYENPDLHTDKYTIDQGALIEEIVMEAEKAQRGEHFSDIFITSPTGSGKSLLFQIPAIYLGQKEGLVTIVVSPLIALMYDQVTALRARNVRSAAYINSTLSLIERNNIVEAIKKGEISILYLSPELLLSYDVRQFIGDRKLGLLVIDEAHLVTTWGRDFRIDYWYLGTYIKRLRKYMQQQSKFPVLALTATAVYGGIDDIVFDTIASLNMQAPKLFIGNIRRDEINFDVRQFPIKGLHELVKLQKTEEVTISNLKNEIKSIVYFPWINQIKSLMQNLQAEYKNRIGIYYSEVEKMEKQIVMDKFQKSDILIVVATKAFGMGIDVTDIRQIYHHAPSGNLSDYVQEIGRVARKKDIVGTAAVDFCPKDLKFTKILTGLSMIKQYQVKYVLQKLNDLYQKYGKRHMLVSVEDFGFIFSDAATRPEELEREVKSALLLLEKDLFLKVNEQYNVIMVRPKALFSIVFACIPEVIERDFLKKYGRHCRLVLSVAHNVRLDTRSARTMDVGNIYELNLNEIWERYFNNESFPSVKYKFFNQTLFTEFGESERQPFPRYMLDISLRGTAQEVFGEIGEALSALDQVFRNLGSKKYFKSETLTSEIRRHFKSEVLARRISNLLTNLYSSGFEMGEFGARKLKEGAFLHTKNDDSGERVYSIDYSRYNREKSYIVRKFNLMFEGSQTSFRKFISSTGSDVEYRIKIAYLIESLLLGSYQVSGGKLSQIYIRINEPYKLQLLAGDRNYTNEVLQDIYKKHKRSVEQMKEFFASEMNNVERWDYIESYFLGKLEDSAEAS